MYAPDFSQIELRVAAFYAREERMIQAFIDGEDIHDLTTKYVFPDDWESESGGVDEAHRKICKMINFGVTYGMGPSKLAMDAGMSVDKAKAFLNRYFSTYPGLKELMKQCQADIVTQGYIESMYGRIFKIDPDKAYKGLNYLVQGTAADIMKRALIRVDELRLDMELDLYLLNTVHDEVIFEIREGQDTPEFLSELRRRLEDWPEFAPIPITVNCDRIIDYWGNHEKVW